MNEEMILSMATPYVKDDAITYDEFDRIYAMLSRREQYAVTEVLFNNGINLIDTRAEEDGLVLDVDAEDTSDYDVEDDDFEVLYDESIFKDVNKSAKRAEVLFINKNILQSNEILCHLIQQGNRQAAQDLCVKNKKLVDKYVIAYQKRYGHHLDFNDLEQVGFLGLLKAAQRFDIQQGTVFSTYAVFWIKQSISREIMDNGYTIRIPVHMMERINKVIALSNQFAGEKMSLYERISRIAQELNLAEKAVEDCIVLRNNFVSYTSLDSPVGDNQESMLGDFIPGEEDESVERLVFIKNLHDMFEEVMSTLTTKEENILKLRFGWDNNEPKTLEEVGQIYHVTRERIRQIEAKALRKMRHPSRCKKLKDFLEVY
ncbi:MAG: sigma-70 family RNA polymerase sigma factor [Clostridiales bacterium]|nr:sigma-70 family RNA polymerase sigma factor [Clostridiales bacterium]